MTQIKYRNQKNFKKLTITTTVLSTATPPPGEPWPICKVHCPHCGAVRQHNVLHNCGRQDCPTLVDANGSQCPGYNLLLGVECSHCGGVQEPGLHGGACLACGEPQGRHIADLCQPELQVLKEQAMTAARGELTRTFKSQARLKADESHNMEGSNRGGAKQVQGGGGLEALQMEKAMVERKRKAALEKREIKRVATMLKAPIQERGVEGEVLFAISDLIGDPKTWKRYLSDIFWSQHWNHQETVKIACFLAHNGLPHHLAQQWVCVRGVVGSSREFEDAWRDTLQGKWPDKAFTWDLIKTDYCLLNTGEPCKIPEGKRSRQT